MRSVVVWSTCLSQCGIVTRVGTRSESRDTRVWYWTRPADSGTRRWLPLLKWFQVKIFERFQFDFANFGVIVGLSEKLESQGIQQKQKRVTTASTAKFDYSTSFTDLIGSFLDNKDDSPGDSDYESGDKNVNKPVTAVDL